MEFVGYIASLMSTISLVPQVLQVIKTNETESLSIKTYSIMIIGSTCWIIYGTYKKDIPILFCNIILLICSVIISIKILINKSK